MAPRNPDLNAEAPKDGADEEDSGLDLERIKELGGYFARAPRRRPRVAITSFIVVLALAVGAAALWPRAYDCDVRILAQRNFMLPALGNPNRNVPREADNPTKNVADMIQQRENVVALVKQVNLLDRWDSTRPPLLRAKDKLSVALFGAPSEEDRLRALVGVLERQLWVAVDDSTITITVEWSTPEIAYELVSLVQNNFLEAQYDSDVAVINEAIHILDERAKEEAVQVDAALAEVMKLEENRRQNAPAPVVPRATTPRVAVRTPTPALAPGPGSESAAGETAQTSLDTSRLDEVRRRVRELEEDRRTRMNEARRQLAEAQTTLGPLHPTVVGLNQKIEQLNQPSPELDGLKSEERALVARLAAPALVALPGGALSPAPLDAPQPSSAVAAPPVSDRDDASTGQARVRLQSTSAKYNELLSRIEGAKIELDVARAAFKYKYTVVRPAEVPRKARKPNVPLLLVGGLLAAVVLALFLSGGIDLLRGRFIESWQVERKLKIPVLGEISPPAS